MSTIAPMRHRRCCRWRSAGCSTPRWRAARSIGRNSPTRPSRWRSRSRRCRRAAQRDLVDRLFEPLGYAVEATPIALDPAHPEWGDSPYVALRLTGEVRLAALLTHLFVLCPCSTTTSIIISARTRSRSCSARARAGSTRIPSARLIVRRYLRLPRAGAAARMPGWRSGRGRGARGGCRRAMQQRKRSSSRSGSTTSAWTASSRRC